ncbi:MAG: carboxylating nicotinate-nucleotide diphosphorylase [Armatimonadota bacterium]|nr:carboxylating nicotinate-nucleotide diphosphorylase [bacterium]
MTGLDPIYIEQVVKTALAEDIGSGDVTTLLTIPQDAQATATLTAKQEGVIAGQDVAWAAFSLLHCPVQYMQAVPDGTRVKSGDLIGRVSGNARGVLTGERVCLNFLQRMSGVATLTAKYVDAVSHTKARIVDTRKTTPGLRRLEKYAVIVGGGRNHRFGLSDGILIKDNHIAAAGGIAPAVNAARQGAPHTLTVEIEVINLDQLREAIDARPDVVMLDNMPIEQMREAVSIANGKVLLEASGGVNLETVRAIAETGVDIISVGALTHSAPAMDISLNIIG